MIGIVLIEPEIPQNTGSIGRLCLAVNAKLHLVKPLGFEITHARLRRAGLDYWEHLDVTVWENLDAYLAVPTERLFFSKKATHSLFSLSIQQTPLHLVFGKETKGLPEHLTQDHAARIPIFDPKVRSLNLAQSAAIATYEVLRQWGHL